MTQTVVASLARIADFAGNDFDIEPRDRQAWATGDYVIGEVTGAPSSLYNVENCAGEMIPVLPGDSVIGAFGVRAATLEGVGSWMDIADGHMECLTNAGLFGAFTSISPLLPDPISLDYVGHLVRNGKKLRMQDYAIRAELREFRTPTIMIVGTSMSAGKTMTGTLICRILNEAGIKVIGVKLTGAGRYRDIISFRRAGAAEVYDFVDAGLGSTVVDADEFRAAIRPFLSHIQSRNVDFMVAEAGASPLEPYNGEAAIEELGDSVVCHILAASDPYAVVGVQKAFRFRPDLITGPATNTSAGIDLVTALTGVRGINILDPGATAMMRDFLSATLGRALA